MIGKIKYALYGVKLNAQNVENRLTFVKLMNECIVAQFLLRHSVASNTVTTMMMMMTIANEATVVGQVLCLCSTEPSV